MIVVKICFFLLLSVCLFIRQANALVEGSASVSCIEDYNNAYNDCAESVCEDLIDSEQQDWNDFVECQDKHNGEPSKECRKLNKIWVQTRDKMNACLDSDDFQDCMAPAEKEFERCMDDSTSVLTNVSNFNQSLKSK